MTAFTDRLDARRKELGLSVQDVVSALQIQGVPVAYSTVAAWFNGGRGDRWSPETLLALLDLLQTDLRSLVGVGSQVNPPDLSSPLYNAASRELASLSEQQQAALLSLIKSFRA